MSTNTMKKAASKKKAMLKPKTQANKPVEVEQQTRNQESIPSCPECGAEMVRRSGPYGDFFGCTNFKSGACKATIKIES